MLETEPQLAEALLVSAFLKDEEAEAIRKNVKRPRICKRERRRKKD